MERRPPAGLAAARQLRDLASECRDHAGGCGPALLGLLGDREAGVRRRGLEAAGAILPFPEVEPLLRARASDPSPVIRVTAIGLIADLQRAECRPVLASALTDEAFTVRFEAARGLAALRHSAGLQVLVEALEYPDLRFRALGALAELGDRAAVPAIRKTFRRWLLPDFDRTQAAGALMKLGETDAAGYLLQRTRSRFGMDRAFAIELCGEVKVKGAFERLLEILRDSKDPARGAAARGLGRLENPDALAAFAELLAEPTISEGLQLDCAEGFFLLRIPAARHRMAEAFAPGHTSSPPRVPQVTLRA